LVEEGYLGRAEQDLFRMSVEEMKVNMRKNNVDLANLRIEDLGIYARPEAALKLSTLHNAKGREYQAVAIVDLHEGRIPFYRAQTAEKLEEAKRLFYVGVTRAKRYLLYVTDSSHPRNEPSRFLRSGGVGIC
jgi:DNA helicase-2/ATP-dependent DNA helicase PcrA